jgi:hypothetical protein
MDRQKQPRYKDLSDSNIFNETVNEVKKLLIARFEEDERKFYDQKLECVKKQFYLKEIRHYDIMKNIPERVLEIHDETSKYDWIDYQIKELAKELLKNYVLADKENCETGYAKKDPEL